MAALKGVVLGSGLLSPAILAIGADLLADAVPAKWAAEWDSGPEAPLAWVTGVVTRRAALLRWAAAAAGAGGDSKALLASGPSRIQVCQWEGRQLQGRSSTPLHLPSPPILQWQDLFRPATFLNALRQLTARALRKSGAPVAMDALKLVSAWDRAALSAAPIAVPVSGLLLQVRREPLLTDVALCPACQR